MMKTVLAVLAATFVCGSAFAHEQTKEEMMKAMQEYGTPSAGHAIFKKLVGKWKYTSKWFETPGAKAEESEGLSTMKLVLGGRFLQHETKGTMMNMPFEGIGYTGFDNIKKTYDTIWMDTMMTGMMHGTGEFDAKTQTLTDKGEMTCPISENHKRAYRSEWKIVDREHMSWAMYGPDKDGKEFKQGEMEFTRAAVVQKAKK
jgi:hypothetical protein